MVSESFAIIAVLLLMLLVSLKAQYRHTLPLVIPFFTVPSSYLLATFLLSVFIVPPLASSRWMMIAIISGGLLGSLLVYIVSKGISTKTVQLGYSAAGVFFSLAFMAAYLVNVF